MKKSALQLLSGLTVSFMLLNSAIFAASIGEKMNNVKLRDADDNPQEMPDFGKKVLAIFYTDPDVADQNDPFADELKKAKLDEATYRGMGVVNMKDTWSPNFAIRMVVKSKIEKYKSTILTDPDYIFKKAWKLGDCDDKSAVFILAKDRTLKFKKLGALTPAEIKSTMALIKKLMAE